MDRKQLRAIEKRLAKLEQLGGGKLKPEVVVEDAKDPKSPYHDLFEWDDSIAGHKYRIEQARLIIKTIKVEVTVDSKTVKTVRYIRDPEAASKEQGYVSVVKLKDNKTLAWEALEMELKRAKSLMDRAKDLAVVLDMADAVTEIIDRIESMQRHFETRKVG